MFNKSSLSCSLATDAMTKIKIAETKKKSLDFISTLSSLKIVDCGSDSRTLPFGDWIIKLSVAIWLSRNS